MLSCGERRILKGRARGRRPQTAKLPLFNKVHKLQECVRNAAAFRAKYQSVIMIFGQLYTINVYG